MDRRTERFILFLLLALKVLYELEDVLSKAFCTLAAIGIVWIEQVADCVTHDMW